jgi:hypothetical protein
MNNNKSTVIDKIKKPVFKRQSKIYYITPSLENAQLGLNLQENNNIHVCQSQNIIQNSIELNTTQNILNTEYKPKLCPNCSTNINFE